MDRYLDPSYGPEEWKKNEAQIGPIPVLSFDSRRERTHLEPGKNGVCRQGTRKSLHWPGDSTLWSLRSCCLLFSRSPGSFAVYKPF